MRMQRWAATRFGHVSASLGRKMPGVSEMHAHAHCLHALPFHRRTCAHAHTQSLIGAKAHGKEHYSVCRRRNRLTPRLPWGAALVADP